MLIELFFRYPIEGSARSEQRIRRFQTTEDVGFGFRNLLFWMHTNGTVKGARLGQETADTSFQLNGGTGLQKVEIVCTRNSERQRTYSNSKKHERQCRFDGTD
ncbi:hypothetical protein J6590_103540 [Homalodisca vitripennis]|nr:hypothetical protein J6590_103540 [Homalodisca vitripennis]